MISPSEPGQSRIHNELSEFATLNQSGPFQIAEGVLFQPPEREAVFLNLKTEQYYGLDPVGTRIWQVLTETQDLEATVKTLLAEYEVEETRLRSDIAALTGRLREKGLLTAQA